MSKRVAGTKNQPQESQTITDLQQIRALADPLRLRILRSLAGEPRTTKQVAELLGEKHTKLYHHVEILEKVGLIRLMSTRQNRGTIEKYYQSIANQFRVGASALCPENGGSAQIAEIETMLGTVLDSARTDLVAHLKSEAPSPESAPLVGRITFSCSEKKGQTIRKQLLRLIESLGQTEVGKATSGKRAEKPQTTYSLTIVYCKNAAS